MPDIRIRREHSLGLTKARKVAWKWAEEVEEKFQMECTVVEGDICDTVEFQRTGVQGRLVVADDHFDLEAKLGFLLGAFAKTIEREIQGNLDALLDNGAAGGAKSGAAKAKAGAAVSGRTGASADASDGPRTSKAKPPKAATPARRAR